VKVIPEADGTYSLAEIAPIVRIPEGTLFRWRWQAQLLTAYDYLVDPDMAFRLARATLEGEELHGPMPPARFNVEDAVRLRIIGHLGEAGWDRARLLEALARPFALPTETGGDLHSPAEESQMPSTLLIWAAAPDRLAREAFATREAADQFSRTKLPLAIAVNLDVFRREVRQELAKVDLARERKAAKRLKGAKV
jgi:hypothetical protein